MIKKPLVLTVGEIEQLQPSDSLLPIPNSLQLTNGESFDIAIGQPVYISVADTVKYAMATTLPNVVGLAASLITPSSQGTIQTDGKISASTAGWDAITGQTGGLVPGATYYLCDSDVGKLTDVPPTTQGNYVVRIGIAISTTDFEINISRPIRL